MNIADVSKYLIWALLLSFAAPLFANDVTAVIEHDGHLEIQLQRGEVTLRPLNKGAIEVFFQAEGVKQLPSFGIDQSAVEPVASTLKTIEQGYLYLLPKFTVKIDTSPYRLSFYRGEVLVAQEEVGAFVTETLRGFRFKLKESEQLFGGGQRILGMDRRGHRMPLYNRAHYGYTTDSNQMYYSLPAVMSDQHYAIGFDNSASGHLDIGHTEHDILQFEAVAGRTSYIFAAGDNLAETVQYFVSATGKQPLPPRWALGNYASRFGYRNQQEVLDVVNGFIEQDFPLDALILDLYWFGPDIKGHMGNLNWDKNAFEDPVGMIETLRNKGVKTILITEPFILFESSQWDSAVENRALAKNLAGKPRRFDFYFGNTGLVDVFDETAQDWFWRYYAALNEQGVAGWWGDLGEPEVHPADSIHTLNGRSVTAEEIHNAYGHQWAKMVYERQLEMRPDERPFVMMRAGFLGSQRYGMIPWTGDVAREWGGLQSQVELSLQMSLFGLAYIHSDLGGFAGGETFDSELYTRWMQYGVFQAVYRPHAQDHIAPEPIFHDKKTKDIVRQFIKLRYELMPYNYSLSITNSLSGMPMMRPLVMHYPKQSMERTDAYLWGEQFLVSPVLHARQQTQTILLPEGNWFDYFNHKAYVGGQEVKIDTPIEKLPVFVKGGAFIPKVEAFRNADQYRNELIYVEFFTDSAVANSQYVMYDDDGRDPNSIKHNAIQKLHFSSSYAKPNQSQQTHTRQGQSQELMLSATLEGDFEGAPSVRTIVFKVIGLKDAIHAVFVDGKHLEIIDNRDALYQQDAAYWDGNMLWISGKLKAQLDITIKYSNSKN